MGERLAALNTFSHNPIPFLIWVGVGFMAVIFIAFPEAGI